MLSEQPQQCWYRIVYVDRVEHLDLVESLGQLYERALSRRDAARLHAQDMADNNYFSHTGLNGSSFMDRILAAGFTGTCPCGENIAAGNSDASSTMTQWINSPGHCENMMGDYTKIGVGYAYNANSTYHHYWVQDFGN